MVSTFSVLSDANNERILDAIRWDSSAEYQHRIPAATDAGVDNVLRKLTEFRPQFNEFENALVNRIGLVVGRSKSWNNPLAVFKKGLLTYGSTIEEFQVGLLKAHNYDPDRDYMEKSLFGRELPHVEANFHTLNRQDFYKVTVNEPLLKRAFLDDYGLSEYVSGLMAAPITSDNWDEFLLMAKLFREYEANGGFYRIQVPEISNLESTQDEARKALRIMRSAIEEMRFISTRYNAAQMPTHASPEELVVFTTPQFRAALDVEALAAAFNIDRADVPSRIVTIPKDQFAIDGCEAIITTQDFFMVGDTLMENHSMFNPVGLGTNYFWHHHQVISASRFVPAVMLTTGAGDEVINVRGSIASIDAITVTDLDGDATTSVERGMTYQVSADVTTDPADFDGMVGVTWDVLGRESARTRISQSGVLVVSGTESAETLTIVATDSNAENEIVAEELTVDVTTAGDATPEWPRDRDGAGEPVEP